MQRLIHPIWSHDTVYFWYEIKLHLVVRLQFWISRKCGVPYHCHYSLF